MAALFYQKFIEHIKAVQHVVDHLAHIWKKKIGVVSGGARLMIQKELVVLNIASHVDVLVCAGDNPNGKPSPDPFLLAAERLGVRPHRCLVFEDSDPGVQAVMAGGMSWIRGDRLFFHGCSYVIRLYCYLKVISTSGAFGSILR